jgi:hypothetical protein
MDSTLPRSTLPAAHQAGLPVGTVIADRFNLVALVDKGGMGSIYRATDSLEGLQRFSREALVLASLSGRCVGRHGPQRCQRVPGPGRGLPGGG